jgi:hypothetical protein
MIVAAARWIAALLLLATPGSWLAFGRATAAYSLSSRFALAIVLSPLVISAEFYLLRLAGLPFDATAFVIVVVNLPALGMIVRRLREQSGFEVRSLVLWLLFLSLPVAYLTMFVGDAGYRANFGHSWNHADIVYMLANGELRPEEPQLAGVRLVYPWLGHVYQGVISFIADSPPNASYLLTNVVWLFAVVLLVANIVTRLGGDRIARASTSAWLCFGVNFAGVLGVRLLPGSLIKRYPVLGDFRYAPWLRKVAVFEQTILGIGIFAAVLFVLTELEDGEPSPSSLLLLGPLLVSAALVYPVLYPATMALIGGHFIVLIMSRVREPRRLFTKGNVSLAVLAIGSAIAGVSYLAVITVDHAGAATMGLSDVWSIKVKTVTSVVVLSPLLAGFALTARGLWRGHMRVVALLAFGAVASMLMHDIVSIYNVANEYKFIFVAAVCLTPFAMLAMTRLHKLTGRGALPVAVAVAVMLASSPLAGVARDQHDISSFPALDIGSFNLSLQPSERLSGVVAAIRTTTPPNAVLVSEGTTVDLVALTRRPLYVQMDTVTETHGVGLTSNFLLKVSRGYSSSEIDARRSAVRALFAADTPWRDQALERILTDLGRPVVVMLQLPEDAAVGSWLGGERRARILFSGDRVAAWMVIPHGPSSPATP